MGYGQIGQRSVSVVGLGCNNVGGRLDEARTKTVVDAARDAGINFFDTADMYGGTKSEVCLGKALKDHRAEVVIATKLAAPGSEDAGAKRGGVASSRSAVAFATRPGVGRSSAALTNSSQAPSQRP